MKWDRASEKQPPNRTIRPGGHKVERKSEVQTYLACFEYFAQK